MRLHAVGPTIPDRTNEKILVRELFLDDAFKLVEARMTSPVPVFQKSMSNEQKRRGKGSNRAILVRDPRRDKKKKKIRNRSQKNEDEHHLEQRLNERRSKPKALVEIQAENQALTNYGNFF